MHMQIINLLPEYCPGRYSWRDTPDPIPNSEVKPPNANDTCGDARRESR